MGGTLGETTLNFLHQDLLSTLTYTDYGEHSGCKKMVTVCKYLKKTWRKISCNVINGVNYLII